jgi:sugar lactone lactonase YvrE
MNEPVCVVEAHCVLGESALWSGAEQALYWVDISNSMIHRLTPADGAHRHWLVETEIGSIGLAGPGRLIAALRSGFFLFDIETARFERLGEVAPDDHRMRFNDGRVDRAGRFWCGTMHDFNYQPVGTLYRLDADHHAQRMVEGIGVPNAIAFSPDDRTLYFADSPRRVIWAYDFDLASGTIENRRVFAEVPADEGFPDGATVDREGGLWNARYLGASVVRYDTAGRIERRIDLPVRQVTSCAFGGAGLDTLYITTASSRMTGEQRRRQPLAGAVFAVEPGVRGLAEPSYGG